MRTTIAQILRSMEIIWCYIKFLALYVDDILIDANEIGSGFEKGI